MPAATLTAPVAGSSVTPAFDVDTWDRMTLPLVAGAPASVSLPSTFATAMPPVAATAPTSSTASIAVAATVTVTVAVSQFAGTPASQMR